MHPPDDHSPFREQCIVLSPGWPGSTSGLSLALRASLRLYRSVYDTVVFVGITPRDEFETWSEETEPSMDMDGVTVRHVNVPRAPKVKRFAKSLLRAIPALSIEFWERRNDILQVIADESQAGADVDVIVEDIPLSVLLPEIHSAMPSATTILRSHHVQAEAFKGFDREGWGPQRLAWSWEIKRIEWLERRALNEADATFAISSADAQGYTRKYDHTPDGIIDVCFQESEHRMLDLGASHRIVHVGSADLRKGHGIQWFVDSVWPMIRERVPRAELHLAGRNTDQFHQPSSGITGIGFVDDDKAFMERGGIFINPQKRGSGLKIKSIVSMLAGRALVSTETGIEGVRGEEGKHFFVRDEPGAMASVICTLIEQNDQRTGVQQAAREFAARTYACQHFIQEKRASFESLSGSPTNRS